MVCYIFGNVIETIPFFQGCSDLFLAAVLCCLEPQLYAPTDVIIQRGQREASMFIIAKGSAGMMNKDGKLVQVLQQGSYFGEIGLFFETRRTTTICSITFCDVFKLTKARACVCMCWWGGVGLKCHDQTIVSSAD